MKYVHKISEIPTEAHYVILENDSVHIPGDERSRTNPGHGYPASDHNYIQMQVTTDKTEWEEEIKSLMENDPHQEKFVAYFVPAIAKVQAFLTVSIT